MSAGAQLLQIVDAAPARPRAAIQPAPHVPAPAQAPDTHARSLVKAVSYRLLSTIVTMALAWGLTQRLALAAAIAGADSLLKIALFYVHERLWARVGFGRAGTDAGRPLGAAPGCRARDPP